MYKLRANNVCFKFSHTEISPLGYHVPANRLLQPISTGGERVVGGINFARLGRCSAE